MKNSWPFKLHQIVGAILNMAIFATRGFGSGAAFPNDIPANALERQTNSRVYQQFKSLLMIERPSI